MAARLVGRITPCAPSWLTRNCWLQAAAGRGLPALPICGARGTEAKAALSRRLVSPKSDEGGSETQAEAQHHGKGGRETGGMES
jgi:hypothetical protein